MLVPAEIEIHTYNQTKEIYALFPHTWVENIRQLVLQYYV
jgi:hypothetical protein